uniref:Uncharacterized protein n=1 Tax=Arundo donax TaxID=35708 RepID=A0A0A9C2Z3_ARUDO
MNSYSGISYFHVKKGTESAAFLIEIWTRSFHMSILTAMVVYLSSWAFVSVRGRGLVGWVKTHEKM